MQVDTLTGTTEHPDHAFTPHLPWSPPGGPLAAIHPPCSHPAQLTLHCSPSNNLHNHSDQIDPIPRRCAGSLPSFLGLVGRWVGVGEERWVGPPWRSAPPTWFIRRRGPPVASSRRWPSWVRVICSKIWHPTRHGKIIPAPLCVESRQLTTLSECQKSVHQQSRFSNLSKQRYGRPSHPSLCPRSPILPLPGGVQQNG